MTRASGLALVEVLVATLLTLAVMAGALAFVARGRAAERSGESLARIEEALDAAFAVLVDDLRMAGYLGLAPPGSPVVGATASGTPEPPGLEVAGSCGPSLAHDLSQPLVVVDSAYQAAPGLPLGCRPGPAGRHAAGSDTLIVRHAAADATTPAPGRLQLETNLRTAAIVADGRSRLGPGARWHDLEVGIYYVSADSTGRGAWPSLRRRRLVGGTRPAFQDEELVSGIADLQILLGLDDLADRDGAVDRWVSAGTQPVTGSVRALRLELEALSDVPDASLPDGRRRKRVARVIELRNGGPPA